jgi:lipopolysaccharide transport system ATP-binding protein
VTTSSLDARLPFWIEVEYHVIKHLPICRIGISVLTMDGTVIFVSYNTDKIGLGRNLEPGNYVTRCQIPGNFLAPTRYTLTIHAEISPFKRLARSENVINFEIRNIGAIGSEFNPLRYGIIRPKLEWIQNIK